MDKMIRICVATLVAALASGCAIKGVSNSSLIRPLPQEPTFQLENMVDSDPAIARKVGQMIAYQLLKRGFRNPPKDSAPDLKVQFSFDVVPEGSTSTAFTTINEPRQRYTVNGDVVKRKAGTATATTFVNTDLNYQKTIAVRILDSKTGATFWEGQVSEVGWCNQIFVTAPNILSLLFERFPEETSNSRKMVIDSDPTVQELRKLFPQDTNWGCR